MGDLQSIERMIIVPGTELHPRQSTKRVAIFGPDGRELSFVDALSTPLTGLDDVVVEFQADPITDEMTVLEAFAQLQSEVTDLQVEVGRLKQTQADAADGSLRDADGRVATVVDGLITRID